jgi:nitroreductase
VSAPTGTDGFDMDPVTGAVDHVLTTTRAVRRRLDFDRPVDNQLLLDCIDVAEQAPTGGNMGSRRWIIVRDPAVKEQLGALYRETALPFMTAVSERLRGTGHRHPHDHRAPRR